VTVLGERLSAPAHPAVRRRPRRRTELGLLVLVMILTAGLYALASEGKSGSLPANIIPFLIGIFALLIVAHVGMRFLAPDADPILLPVAGLLNGIGYVFIARLVKHDASLQAIWTAIGVAAFLATLVVVRRARDLARYRYSFGLLGVALLLLPLLPHFGESINGGRLYVHFGPVNFEPAEAAKIVLAIFFASVMSERAELLSTPTRRIGRFMILDPKYLAPILLAWGFSLIVLTAENDLGSSFLFFALFIGMLFVATGRWLYVGLGGGLFATGAVLALKFIGHAQSRVQAWINPWPRFNTSGYQIIQGWFAIAAGGVFGDGPGQGTPQQIPEAPTDFIFAAIAEEIGLVGATAVLIGILLMVGTGLRIATRAIRPFEKLLATGLSLILGIQTFVIVAGVTRLIPLTGITLPFVSYGGSSLVTNYILIALLLRLSNDVNSAELEQA
jgi:cell division protein FtsW (lipid II flippase)